MKFENLSQAVEYTYSVDGKNRNRTLQNVKESASADNLVQVGKAIMALMGKDLHAVTLIKREGVDLAGDQTASGK